MAKYLNRLNSRLSQPKLQSPARNTIVMGSSSSQVRSGFKEMATPASGSLTNRQTIVNSLAKGRFAQEVSSAEKTVEEGSHGKFSKRNNSVIMKNNSVADLYGQNKAILKPKIQQRSQMRNSMNGGVWDTSIEKSPEKVQRLEQRMASLASSNGPEIVRIEEGALRGPNVIIQNHRD